MPETAEELCQQPEVREELARATGKQAETRVAPETKDKLWFVTHALLLGGCVVLYVLIGSKFIALPPTQLDLTRRFLRGLALIVGILAAAKAVKVYLVGRIRDPVTRFTLGRIQNLVVSLVIVVIAASIVFVNW